MVSHIRQLLDSEHAALVSGDLEALGPLRDQLLESLERMELGSLDAETLADLRVRATRNTGLVLSARRGLESAMERLADCKKVAAGLTTYGPDGLVHSYPESRPKVERRA